MFMCSYSVRMKLQRSCVVRGSSYEVTVFMCSYSVSMKLQRSCVVTASV